MPRSGISINYNWEIINKEYFIKIINEGELIERSDYQSLIKTNHKNKTFAQIIIFFRITFENI